MFTAPHFIWLGLCAAAVAVMLWVALRTRMTARTASVIMSCAAAVSELTKIMTDMTDSASEEGGMVIDPGSLPFHLCSLMIFVVFTITLTKNDRLRSVLISLLVPVGICGAACALLIPTSGVDFLDIDAWQCFVYHAALIWYALYFVVTRQVDLGRRAYGRNLLILTALAFVMIWVNGALSVYDTNFMYVVRPPMEDLPVLNLDHGWYVYFLTLLGVGFALISLVHLPALIAEIKIGRNAGKEPSHES